MKTIDKNLVVFLVDDDAMFLTALKHKIPFTSIILHDKRYNLLTLFQNLKYEGRYSDTSIETFDFAKFLNDLGGFGIRIDSNKEIDYAIAKAFSYNGPSLIEAVVDTNLIPPILMKLGTPKK